jgi:hypothetical protein
MRSRLFGLQCHATRRDATALPHVRRVSAQCVGGINIAPTSPYMIGKVIICQWTARVGIKQPYCHRTLVRSGTTVPRSQLVPESRCTVVVACIAFAFIGRPDGTCAPRQFARANRLTRSGAVSSAPARGRAAAQLLTDFGYS